jgi:tetratricopeptide (TPR) repeat protein
MTAFIENSNREIRVFISSTFRDMQEERHYLMSHVFPVVRRACRDRQVEFTEIDLRWGVTQEEAEQGKVLRICLEEINRCRPYFVSLLGDRYGWAPLDTDLDHKAELLGLFPFLEDSLKGGLSVTEMEILHGVLDNPDMAEHCFFYLRDTGLSQLLADKFNASNDYFETESPLKAKLSALKARLRNSGLPVRDNYTNMEALGELIKTDLLAALDKQFPQDQTPTPFKAAQDAHRSYARELCHAYSANPRDIEALDTFLQTKTNHALLVTGESGLGKSALLAYWISQQRLANPKQFIIEHYIGISGDVDPAAIVYRIMAEIKHRLNDGQDLPSTPEDVIRDFPLWLAKVGEQDPLLLIIDGLNQLDSKECLWLPIFWQENVTAIFSVIPGDQLELLGQRDWPIHTLEMLDVKRKEQLIRDWLATYRKALSTQQSRRIAQAPQTGNPLFLKTVLEELRVFGYFEHLDQRIDTLLTANNPQELFVLVLERLEKDFGKAIVTQIMQALWAASRGLSETEIAGITGLSRLSISTFLMAIDAHLAKRGGLLNFFHNYLRLAVKHYCFENKQTEANVHIKLAHYFNNQELSDRVAEELPWQWQQAQQWEPLKDCISAIPLFSILYKKDDLALLGYWLAMGDQYDPGQCYLKALEKWEEENIVESKTLVWTLDALGYFLSKRFVQLPIAESIYHRALEISEANFGVDHPGTAMIISNCAMLLSDQGNYEEAERLYYRSLVIRKQIFGTDHINTADVLNNLAELCRIIGQFEKAEQLCHKALKIYEKELGPEHLSTAKCLNNLALLLKTQGNFDDAEPLNRRALIIYEKVLGRSHPDTAISLNNLANLLSNLKPNYRKAVGTEHPDITPVLNNLANELNDQRNEEAELLYRRALAIRENVLGAQHHRTACSLNNLVNFLKNQGGYEEAEILYRRALSCYEKTLGTDHLDTAMILNNLALLLHEKSSYEEAEDLYHRAINIYQRVLGEDHFDTAMSIQNLADLLSDQGRNVFSEQLYRRALKIYEKVLGNHINTAGCLNNLGNLLSIQGCFKDAEPLYRRALVIYEKEQGDEHPDTTMTLMNLAMSLTDQGKLNDAVPLYKRVCTVTVKVLGADHSDTIDCFNRLEVLLKDKLK